MHGQVLTFSLVDSYSVVSYWETLQNRTKSMQRMQTSLNLESLFYFTWTLTLTFDLGSVFFDFHPNLFRISLSLCCISVLVMFLNLNPRQNQFLASIFSNAVLILLYLNFFFQYCLFECLNPRQYYFDWKCVQNFTFLWTYILAVRKVRLVRQNGGYEQIHHSILHMS